MSRGMTQASPLKTYTLYQPYCFEASEVTMESRKEAEISNVLFDMLDDPFNAKLPDLAVVNLYKLAKDRRI